MVPLLAGPLCEGLRALTTAPDNHGDALQCYNSNYWLLRVWNASCSGGRVDMAHVVIKNGNHRNSPADYDSDYVLDEGRWKMTPIPFWPFVTYAWTYP